MEQAGDSSVHVIPLVSLEPPPHLGAPAEGNDNRLDINAIVEDCCRRLGALDVAEVRSRLNSVRRWVRKNPLLREALLDAGHELLAEAEMAVLLFATDDVTLTDADEIRAAGETVVGACVRVTIASRTVEPLPLIGTPMGLDSLSGALQCCKAGFACHVVFGVGRLIHLYLPVFPQ